MSENHDKRLREEQEMISRQTELLADEVRLLAINLAVAVAKVQHRERSLRDLEPQFAELIRGANEIAARVTDVVRAFQSQKTMIWSVPASSEIIAQRGAYDKIEANLNQIHALSQRVQEGIAELKSRHSTPPPGPISHRSGA